MDHIKYTQMHFHLYPTPTRDFTMSRDHHMDIELYEFDLEGFYDLKWPQLTEIWSFIFPWRNNRSHNDGFWRTRQLYLTKLTKFSKKKLKFLLRMSSYETEIILSHDLTWFKVTFSRQLKSKFFLWNSVIQLLEAYQFISHCFDCVNLNYRCGRSNQCWLLQ